MGNKLSSALCLSGRPNIDSRNKEFYQRHREGPRIHHEGSEESIRADVFSQGGAGSECEGELGGGRVVKDDQWKVNRSHMGFVEAKDRFHSFKNDVPKLIGVKENYGEKEVNLGKVV
eukprot:CAMPEP_0196999440 /NCGR_PEP_ID=MMETSP1380-20130617/4617_1 /TAXON_ID=5936 /ORGANISM="Euplotes crassus, Strain CT5" /LENGTH=116 /DNA_ID=CAMNT_0042416365 /DNA_START=11 /DNA_END=361 /DNA_ORIENTATION=-